MAVMLLIIYLYYSVAVYPGTAKPDILVPNYDMYGQEYGVDKRDVNHGSEEAYNGENYYYNEPVKSDNSEDDEISRNKRENLTTPASPSSMSTDQGAKSDTKSKTRFSKTEKIHKETKITSTNYTSDKPQEEEEVLDFKLSNNFVDAIQAHAEQNRIKEPLGLCRKNTEVSMPSMNVTLFPLEQAEEIITCINEILKHQSKKRLCIELNEEMSAYLKWLVLTGDSKERRKQIKISAYHDDFLFPTTCGAMHMEGLTEYNVHSVNKTRVETRVETKVETKQEMNVKTGQGGGVQTTCSVVKAGKGKRDTDASTV